MFKSLVRTVALSSCALSFVVVDIPTAEAKLNCSGFRSQCVRWCNEWTETWDDYNSCRAGCLTAHGVCLTINSATIVFVREPPTTPQPGGPKPGGATTQPGLLETSPGLSPQGPAGTGGKPPAAPSGPVLR